MFYKFPFTGDYHTKEDNTHDIRVIYRDLEGNEIAYCEGNTIPEYGEEMTQEEIDYVTAVEKY